MEMEMKWLAEEACMGGRRNFKKERREKKRKKPTFLQHALKNAQKELSTLQRKLEESILDRFERSCLELRIFKLSNLTIPKFQKQLERASRK